MADLELPDIPDVVFAELQTLARRSEVSVEDYVKDVICDAVAQFWHSSKDDITITQLQANLKAILRVAEREPVFIVREDGQRHVLLPPEEFERINRSTEDR